MTLPRDLRVQHVYFCSMHTRAVMCWNSTHVASFIDVYESKYGNVHRHCFSLGANHIFFCCKTKIKLSPKRSTGLKQRSKVATITFFAKPHVYCLACSCSWTSTPFVVCLRNPNLRSNAFGACVFGHVERLW